MPKVIVTTRDGNKTTIENSGGISLMEVLRENGIEELLAICGGCCSCATCHVYVDPEFAGKLPRMSIEESELLSVSAYRTEQSRLSCQVLFAPALDGLKVTIAPQE